MQLHFMVATVHNVYNIRLTDDFFMFKMVKTSKVSQMALEVGRRSQIASKKATIKILYADA